jgi:hypothetical protein
MVNRTGLLVVAAVLAGVLALGVLVKSSQAGIGVWKFVERATTDAVTDTGAAGDSAGDILTFANEVFDEHNAEKVGTDNGWCVRTVAGKAWECFWTLSLADGQITVEGPFYDAGDSSMAVTGGTGAYSQVRGWMSLHSRNDKGTEYDFTYFVTTN